MHQTTSPCSLRRGLLSLVLLCAATTVGVGQATQDSTAEWRGFLERKEYMLRDGGRWTAQNPKHDPKQEGSPVAFGYVFTEGYGPSSVRLRITGAVGDKNYLYWEGAYFWHPVENRVRYYSLGTGGAVAAGASIDAEGALVFDIIFPDGRLEVHRDTERRVGPDEFVSTSYKLAEGVWTLNQSLTWRRVRKP